MVGGPKRTSLIRKEWPERVLSCDFFDTSQITTCRGFNDKQKRKRKQKQSEEKGGIDLRANYGSQIGKRKGRKGEKKGKKGEKRGRKREKRGKGRKGSKRGKGRKRRRGRKGRTGGGRMNYLLVMSTAGEDFPIR
jgi:hypothetical protein